MRDIPRCPTCNEPLAYNHQENEHFKDKQGVVRVRELAVYRCTNTECSNNDNHKFPAQ